MERTKNSDILINRLKQESTKLVLVSGNEYGCEASLEVELKMIKRLIEYN